MYERRDAIRRATIRPGGSMRGVRLPMSVRSGVGSGIHQARRGFITVRVKGARRAMVIIDGEEIGPAPVVEALVPFGRVMVEAVEMKDGRVKRRSMAYANVSPSNSKRESAVELMMVIE